MPAKCDRPGLAFQYPENWTLEEEDVQAGPEVVTVQAPGSGFLSISRHADWTDPKRLAEAAVEALQQVYPTAEAHCARQRLAGHEMVGYDVNFYCLDLVNTAKVRCARAGGVIYAVFCQAEDREFAAIEPVFAAITVSLFNELDVAS